MLITTTAVLQDCKVLEYKGLVTARNVRALSFIRDFFTAFRDFWGGRSESYETVMEFVQQGAIDELERQARMLGANAIIGFNLDFDNIGSKNKALLMAFATGTAVVLEENFAPDAKKE